MTTPDANGWLALLHQLPARPPYARVKIWRRLQAMGAVPLKNAAHVLPRTPKAEVAFRALMEEVNASGGEATLIDARLLAGQSDDDVRQLFDAARDADYREIVESSRQLLETGPVSGAEIARLQKRMADIEAIDFFGAPGQQAAQAALADLDRQRYAHPDVGRANAHPPEQPLNLKRRIWVTRSGVHVDRIACAWAIRRFIDGKARFRFVDARHHTPQPDELRFDMADGEITHEEDRCSFETLLLHAELTGDAALVAIGEIIHDLDIGDGRFARPEAAGLGAILSGICASSDDDLQRIAMGSDALNQFHAYFSSRTAT
ncbi:ChrB protein [Sphingobium amiense]|uniref:ChrB protein n=1 Tax=Sphingobium amiense TaxID=135719 RepID=A0A494WDT1_9SPHN|nr:chromate resistance protein ChrB domain-containing protein [Sphingobium amiense]BBD98885.1 ChrB protein [Sphingobium amiense]